MKLNVDPLLEAIERYIAKTDDDLEEQLNEEGYVEAGVAVAHMGTIEDGVTAAVENNVDEVLARLQSASGVDDFIETVWPEISNSDEMEKALHDLFYQQFDELLHRFTKQWIISADPELGEVIDDGITKPAEAFIKGWSQQLANLMHLNTKDGDTVTHNKKLYIFDKAHSAGTWAGTDTTEIGEAADVDFLKVNDGWIKQIKEGGHILDKSSEAEMSLDMFYQMVASIPNKYNNGKLRWLMSPRRAQQWELFLLNLVAHHGGAVPDNMYTAPVKIPTVECPSMSDDVILLTDPKNLIVVNSYTVKIRSTNTDKESIMMDKRFYVAHLDYDPIIEEKDATGILLLKR